MPKGARLVRQLLLAGHEVRVLIRDPARVRDLEWIDRVEVTTGDAGNREDLDRAMVGIDVAYYLMHSIQQGSHLEQAEQQVARTFAEAARANNVGRIVYLGGLAHESAEGSMSPHMRSRVEVGRILRESGVETIELRAAVIIGSGSASFEMLRHLTERLPAMITPRWVRTRIQPIAIRDVLRYLVACADLPPGINRAFDIGGPDVLTYQEMMQRYARVAGIPQRIILPINVLTPELSSHWVNLVTPVPRAIARPLVRSLRQPAVCHESDIRELIPDPPQGLMSFDDAVRLALTRIREANVATRWSSASVPGRPSDPLPSDPQWTGGTLYEDVRVIDSPASVEAMWTAVEGIGGEHGWYSSSFLWEVRGLIDRLAGGVGLRRGRRDPEHLRIGDAVDFWRVEDREPPRLLRLRAEMKMPGRAWLEFTIAPHEGGSRLTQRAVYWPRSFAGHMYWWSVAPFHAVVFPPMVRRIADEAEAIAASRGRSDTISA